MTTTQQVTPGGIVVCVREPLTAEELAAVDSLAEVARRQEEARRAALTPEERADLAERHARLRRIQRRAQEDR